MKEEQWALAKNLVNILQEFEVAATIVSGQKYVTLSLMLPVVSHLASSASSAASSAGLATAQKFAAKLKTKLTDKFHLDNIDGKSITVKACTLDPRFRNLPFLNEQQQLDVKQEVVTEAEVQW